MSGARLSMHLSSFDARTLELSIKRDISRTRTQVISRSGTSSTSILEHLFPGGYRTDCKGIYYVVRPASSTTWFISAEEWSPGRIWTSQDREAQYAVPELQLRRLGDVGDYAGRVFQPPPVPHHLTRQDHLGSHPLNETPTQPSSVPRYPLRNIARRGDHQSV